MDPLQSSNVPSADQAHGSTRSDRVSLSLSVRSDISVASFNARNAKHVRITGDTDRTSWAGRTKTIKDSVMNLQTLAPKESQDSISYLANSILEIALHCMKTWLGVGILAMPYAYYHSGLVVGILSTVIITAGFRYCFESCLKILAEVKTAKDNENLRFHDAMAIAFQSGPNCIKWMHRPWTYIWKILHSMVEFGMCAIYNLFMAQNLAQIYEDDDILWSVKSWMLCVYGAICILILVPDFRRIMPFSLVGVFLQLLGLILIVYFLTTNLPPIRERNMYRPIEMYAIFLGVLCFEFGPLTYVSFFSLKNTYTPISVTVAVTIIALLKCFIGFFGYWKYGDETLPSITLNLPNESEFAQWIRLLYIVGIFLFNVNHVYNFVHPIWFDHVISKLTKVSPIWKQILRYLIRLGFVTISTAIAMSIPRLGLLMSTFAILPNLIFGFVFVPLAELSVFWPGRHLDNWKRIAIRNITLLILGIGLVIPAFGTNLYFLFNSLHYGEGYDFLPCNPNSISGTLKIYCNITSLKSDDNPDGI